MSEGKSFHAPATGKAVESLTAGTNRTDYRWGPKTFVETERQRCG